MFTLRKCSLGILFLAVLVFSVGVALVANQITRGESFSSRANEELYERVMDLVFPREILKDKKVRFAFVLRYQPTFRPESQIVIVRRQDGIEVTTYKSLDGNIETKLDERIRHGTQEVPEQLAKQLKVQKSTVMLSAVLASKLHSDFFEALRLSEQKLVGVAPDRINITADGTAYRLWYSGATDIQCDLQGSDITKSSEPDEPPLMEWMKNMSRRFLP